MYRRVDSNHRMEPYESSGLGHLPTSANLFCTGGGIRTHNSISTDSLRRRGRSSNYALHLHIIIKLISTPTGILTRNLQIRSLLHYTFVLPEQMYGNLDLYSLQFIP